ncbi:MAG: MMPL family transporter, partial [Actinomycetes bacterium]
MSTWIYRLARASWHARRRVVAAWIAILLLLGAIAATVGGSFDDEFRIPGASSQEALDQLRMTFPEAAMASASLVLLAPEGALVTDATIRGEVERAAAELEEIDWVAIAQLPYNDYVAGLISDDQTAALINVRVDGYSVSTFTDAHREQLRDAGASLERAIPGSRVHVGGDLFSVTMPHLTPVEGIGIGVAVIVLVLVLNSLRAALMPVVSALLGAGLSILLIVAAAG